MSRVKDRRAFAHRGDERAVGVELEERLIPPVQQANGKQYIIVAVSGGNYTGEYIAFALPDSLTRATSQGGQH